MKSILFKRLKLFKLKATDKPVSLLLPATRIDFKAFSEIKPEAKIAEADLETNAVSSEMQTLIRLLDNGVI